MKALLATSLSLAAPVPGSVAASMAPIVLSGKNTAKHPGLSTVYLILINLGILAVIAAGAWWVTGLDKSVSGESKRGHHLTRGLRTGVIVLLASIFLWFLEQPDLGYGGVPILIIIPLCMGLVLRSALSEMFAGGFLGLLDPTLHDHRQFDPHVAQRYQDTIARLIHTGRHDEAIKLCEELKKSGEVPLVTLENTLEFLGVKQSHPSAARPLLEASRMRAAGDYEGAERLLRSLLYQNPADEGAALMLIRVYAQDLREPELARKVLDEFAQQPRVSAGHVEFARRSLDEWLNPSPLTTEQPIDPPAVESQSIDELLAQGSLGTAVERLLAQIREEPRNLRLRLRLAEVYAVNCENLVKAEKIIFQIIHSPGVSADITSYAQARLEEWRAKANATQDQRFQPPG